MLRGYLFKRISYSINLANIIIKVTVYIYIYYRVLRTYLSNAKYLVVFHFFNLPCVMHIYWVNLL